MKKKYLQKKGEQHLSAATGNNSGHILQDNRPKTPLQQKQAEQNVVQQKQPEQNTVQLKENNTGLPDNLKSGVENLSGHSMDDVKVHYNSSQPAQLNAHAYAQGNQIHVAPGQEKHLPHEAWHVVQQKQGRVKPTKQLKGKTNLNDDAGLEKEADAMGAKALQMRKSHYESNVQNRKAGESLVQRYVKIKDPERMYDNFPRLLALVTSAIRNVVAEHAHEPFYQRILSDMKFFAQIVEDLFKSDPEYNKMKDFTDEIIQAGLAKSDYDPEKYTKEEWALLHRMESKSFHRFVESKEGTSKEESVKHEYEKNNSKYNPLAFGDKHTWEGNSKWLVYVIQHFSKLVVTDIPIAIANLFRQKENTQPKNILVKKGEKDFQVFSAYGRELAALLYEGYVPVSANTVGVKGLPAISIVKANLLPPTVLAALYKKVKINKAVAYWIAKGDSSIGIGKSLDERGRVRLALSFFHSAGIPAEIEEPESLGPDGGEHKTMKWASKSLQPEDEDQEKRLEHQRQKEEERRLQSEEKSKAFKKVKSGEYVEDEEGLFELIRERYKDIKDAYKKYGNTGIINGILTDAPGLGLIKEGMSKNKMLEFLKQHRDRIWPQEE